MSSQPARSAAFLTAHPIAHRGLHDRGKGVIENSRSAFAAAIAKGYAIECDLQRTSDGEAVVFHDDTVDRVMQATGWVKDKTAAEVATLAFKGGADKVQTLAELLQQVAGQVPLVIELKSHWDGDVRLVARAIEGLKDYQGDYCLMSFDPDMVQEVRRLSPSTIRGIVAERAFDPYYHHLSPERLRELRTFGHLGRTDPDFVSFYYDELPFAPVEIMRAMGRPIITWTIRNPEQEQVARRFSDQITFEGYLA